MPSVGRIKKLSVLGIAAVSLGVSANSASAADVWVWNCHGPDGSPLFDQDGAEACSSATGTLDAKLNGHISVSAPPETSISAVNVRREATGLGGTVTYTGRAGNTVFESATADFGASDKVAAVAPPASGITLGLACATAGCENSDATLKVSRVGLQVTDTIKPQFAVGGWSSPFANPRDAKPENDYRELDIAATDGGTGLRYAEAWLAGMAPVRAPFEGANNCEDLTPGDESIDLKSNNDCMRVGHARPKINTKLVEDSPHQVLTVKVVDWAGNESITQLPTEVLNKIDLGTHTQTLSIGTSGLQENPSPNNGNSGGVGGATSSSCRSPRLSFSLDQKPMRVSKGVPVLQYGKRYRFTGRLTCVVNGKRRSAPKRTRVDIFNKIGKKTYDKRGTTVGASGRLRIILSYKSSRTIIFRHTNANGQRSQVSIKVKVERKKKKSRR
jgi:hypothetical protein